MNTRVPPVAQVLLCGALGWGLSILAPSPPMDGPWFILLAALLCCSGLVLLAFAVGAFVREKTTVNPLAPESAEALVTTGLFRFSRNPMYLGMLFVLTACMISLGAWSSVLAPVLFIWVMTEFQIKPEERALQNKFGEQFTLYRSRTRRWI